MKRDWIQLITNVAVVCGLLLLLYELNQSRNLTRAQVVDNVYGAAVNRNLALLGESPERAIAKSVFDPEDITQSEAVVLNQFYTALLVSWLRNKDTAGVGYFQEGFRQVVAQEAYFLNSIPGRKWWASIRPFQDPELAEAVDDALANITLAQQKRMLENLVGSKQK